MARFVNLMECTLHRPAKDTIHQPRVRTPSISAVWVHVCGELSQLFCGNAVRAFSAVALIYVELCDAVIMLYGILWQWPTANIATMLISIADLLMDSFL